MRDLRCMRSCRRQFTRCICRGPGPLEVEPRSIFLFQRGERGLLRHLSQRMHNTPRKVRRLQYAHQQRRKAIHHRLRQSLRGSRRSYREEAAIPFSALGKGFFSCCCRMQPKLHELPELGDIPIDSNGNVQLRPDARKAGRIGAEV